MNCSICNAEIPENQDRCPHCGAAAQPAAPPEPPKESKNLKKGLIIGGGVVVAAAAGIGIFMASNTKDPKTVVMDALKGVYSAENVNPGEEVFGLGQIYGEFSKTGGEMGGSLAFAGSSNPDLNMLMGAGVNIHAASDVTNKKFVETVGIQYSGMDLANLTIYADDTYLMAALPEFTSRVLTVNYADDLAGQIANSPLAAEIEYLFTEEEKEAFENYIAYLTDISAGKKTPFDLKALWQRYKEGSQAMNNFKEAITVTKADSQTFSYDGKEQKCTGYDVVIPKEAVVDFARTSSKFFLEDESFKKDFLEYLNVMMDLRGIGLYETILDEEFSTTEEMLAQMWENMDQGVEKAIAQLEKSLEGDVTMKVYVTKPGRLASLDGTCRFVFEEEDPLDVKLTAVLEGGSYPTQNGNFNLILEDGTDTLTVELEKAGEYTDKVLNSNWDLNLQFNNEKIQVTYDNDYDRETGDSQIRISGGEGKGDMVSLTITGIVDELEKGKNFHYTFDSLEVAEENWAMSLKLKGEFYLRNLQSEIIAPQGEQMDVLKATEEEWEELGNEILMNLYSLILGGGFF